MSCDLTAEDAAEIYAALQTKLWLVRRGEYGPEDRPGDDKKWAAHLESIMEIIGPDGEELVNP